MNVRPRRVVADHDRHAGSGRGLLARGYAPLHVKCRTYSPTARSMAGIGNPSTMCLSPRSRYDGPIRLHL